MPKVNFKFQIACLEQVSRRKANFKFKFLVIFVCLLISTALSGCSAIGFNDPAALQVTSVPEASIFLDGKHLGKTPFFSDQLKKGEHQIKITADGATYVSKIFLEGSTLTVVNRQLASNFLAQSGETLTLMKGKNGLFIVSDPANSVVNIDGKLSGTTPVLIKKIADGEHKISLSKEGFITREFTIKSTGSYQLLVNANLASEIAKQLTLPSPEEPKIQKIEILTTPQGFLRIRQEANTLSPEIGRVKTGDQLELLQEIKDWSKVVFSSQPANKADKQGWVSTQYTKKLP